MRCLRGERGQTTSEYVGLLLVVAAVIAAISASGIAEAVRAKVDEAIVALATDEGLGEPGGGGEATEDKLGESPSTAARSADYRPHLSEARIAAAPGTSGPGMAPAVVVRSRSRAGRPVQASVGGALFNLIRRLFGGGGPKPAPRPPVKPPAAKPAPKPPAKPTPKTKPELRRAYEEGVRRLAGQEIRMRRSGASAEAIARTLHRQRRELGERFKELTPPALRRRIYERNLERYGDPLGPSIKFLRQQGKSWEEIIESAKRTGGRDLGL